MGTVIESARCTKPNEFCRAASVSFRDSMLPPELSERMDLPLFCFMVDTEES